MPYDFHKLKTVSVANGEVTLRIPERWTVVPHERVEGCWGCYEEEAEGEDTDTGTLWIRVDHYLWNGEEDPPPGFDVAAFTKRSLASMKADLPPLIEDKLTEVEDGYRWHRVYDVSEDGEALRFWFSHFFLGRPGHLATISFNLVLTHERMEYPEFLELRKIIMREIEAAFLDPFRIDDEDEAEERFGAIRCMNFAGAVKVTLPDVFGAWDEEDEAQGWGSGNPIYRAGIDIANESLALCDETDKTLVSVDEAAFIDVLRNFVGLRTEGISLLRIPNGAIAYRGPCPDQANRAGDIGGGEADDEDRKGKHEWWNMRFEHGKAQVTHITVRPSKVVDNGPPHPALVDYMHRAVRRAEFPGFTPSERF